MNRSLVRLAPRFAAMALFLSCLQLSGCGGGGDLDEAGAGDGGRLDGSIGPAGKIDSAAGTFDGGFGPLDQALTWVDAPAALLDVALDAPITKDASPADVPVVVPWVPVAAACPTAASTASAGAVVSTATGGAWFAKATWVGGAVPTPNQDVIINGEVQIDSLHDNTIATCRTMFVSATGVVRGAAYTPSVLYVKGDLLNQGIVRNGPGYASYDTATLEVRIGGSFYQGNGYGVVNTRFMGTQEQFIAVADTKTLNGVFVDENSVLPLKGCSPISANAFSLTAKAVPAAGMLDMQTNALTLAAGDVKFSGGALRASRIIGVAGATFTCDRVVAAGTLSLEGDVRIGNMIVDGNVKVAASAALYNQAIIDATLTINGNVENLGTLRWGPGYAAYSPGTLTVILSGNLVQGGVYTVTSTQLRGTVAQTISVGTGKVLTGTFSDTTATSPIVAGSDLAIADAVFDLGKTTDPTTSSLKMGSYKIVHTAGDLKIATGILEADDMAGSADGTSTFTIANVTPPSGTFTVHGHFRTDSMKVTGSLAVATGSVVYNKSNVEARLVVSGTVGGAGVIGSGPGYASYDTGVVYLNGLLQPGWTRTTP